ncbi:TenA family protein [uncultured Legionella sp.]|uniref:TenA family protein n=1 Tax=uncultured Legionella sp. TaxID=210934 RepID=UPI002621C31F|nr:TenA family protein [uncultured Legionella sp.]
MHLFKYCKSSHGLKTHKGFVHALLATNKTKLQLIYQHPFNQQLFAGTLEQEVFGRYLRDDFWYLHEFSLAIGQVAKRATTINPELSRQLSTLAHEVITNEQIMQLRYATHFNHHTKHQIGVTVTEYSKYLIDTAMHAEIPHALCSILPCFWIYYQLGVINRTMHGKQNPYHDWIATYSSPDFIKVAQELAITVQLIADKSDQTTHLQMTEFFSKSIAFELDFFNEVYPDKSSEKHPCNETRNHSY